MEADLCPICDEEDIIFLMGDYPRPDQLRLCGKHKGKVLMVEIKDKSYLRPGARIWFVDEKKLKKTKIKIPKEKIIFITTENIEKMKKDILKKEK